MRVFSGHGARVAITLIAATAAFSTSVLAAAAAPSSGVAAGVVSGAANGVVNGGGPDVQTLSPRAEAVPTAVVSLGDSYSSGLGTGDYTDSCDRTERAWGQLIFGSEVTDRTLLACSGAALADMPAQVAALAALSDSAGGRLVTVTVGGNDLGFADELTNCLVSLRSCAGREAALVAEAKALEDPLAALYDDIQAAAPGDEVIVGGYPYLVPDPAERSSCSALTGLLTKAERQMIRRVGAALNEAIDKAAARTGVRSAASALELGFDGHEACDNSSQDWLWGLKLSWPWGAGPQGAAAEGPGGEPLASAYDLKWEVTAKFVRDSFHPNDAGQAGYARAFEQQWSAG